MNFEDALTELFQLHEYEMAYRLKEMYESRKLRSKTFYRILGFIWSMCESMGGLSDLIYETMHQHTTPGTLHIPVMMTREEQKALAALPEKLEVYRGCNPVNRDGFSWTLDRSTAEWFAYRFSSIKGQPILLTATIERSMITAVNLSRKGEREVILFYMPGDDEVKEVALPIAA